MIPTYQIHEVFYDNHYDIIGYEKTPAIAFGDITEELYENFCEMMKAFDERRKAIVEGLNRIPGFSCVTPKGAFYAFPNITGTGLSASELQDSLLTQAGVAILAGTSFGALGEGYLRFSYASSMENIERALERVAHHLQPA